MDVILQQLCTMCKDKDFDTEIAKSLFSNINLNEPFSENNDKYMTTWLGRAILYENVKMVEIMLKHGADPNIICNDESPFWDLQYNVYTDRVYEENEEMALEADENNLKMAQLMLEYGANPCLVVDGENLFDYVLDEVFNDDPGRLMDYRCRFFILLIAYGGKTERCVPSIVKPFDKEKLLKYNFRHVSVGSGYYLTGEIVDENYQLIATV